jgi:uncharacterized protein with GYD domain
MPRYAVEASYTREEVVGVLAKGGSTRRDALAETAAGLGGQLECFYFGFGDHDAFVIFDVPDNEAAAALADDGQRRGWRGREDHGAVDAGAVRRGGEALGRPSAAG